MNKISTRFLAVIGFLLCVVSIEAFAKSTDDQLIKQFPYQLVMSMNKGLCESMLDLYNHDMITSGRINYDVHDIFSQIHWSNINEFENNPSLRYFRADFDINNDGKIETVLKLSGHVLAVDVDQIRIYPSDAIYQTPPTETGVLGKLKDTSNLLFSADNNIYYLKDLSPKLQAQILEFKLKHLPKYLKKVNTQNLRTSLSRSYIPGSFVLKPFIWEGVAYISMTSRNPEWIVVSKYKQAEELQDICYIYNSTHRYINY
jgi:hypothetical protein